MMRKLLNTLYILQPEAYLAKDGENVTVRLEDEVRFRIPIHTLEAIVQFGYPGASPALLKLCAEKGVTVTFCDQHGRFLARVEGPVSGNVLLRRKQYRIADSEADTTRIAGCMVAAKILNARNILQRHRRDHPDAQSNSLDANIYRMFTQAQRSKDVESLDQLRGIEGDAAGIYFSEFDHLILNSKDFFYFHSRNRRPPLDAVNCLLSFYYTLLVHECRSALECVGLDPAVGFLHRDRPGRPSLALDLMEEFRPYLADRLVLTLINRLQVEKSDFRKRENGAVEVEDKIRGVLLTEWQNRKHETIQHPFLNVKVEIGLLPYIQALLLARHLRGELDDYPAFVWK